MEAHFLPSNPFSRLGIRPSWFSSPRTAPRTGSVMSLKLGGLVVGELDGCGSVTSGLSLGAGLSGVTGALASLLSVDDLLGLSSEELLSELLGVTDRSLTEETSCWRSPVVQETHSDEACVARSVIVAVAASNESSAP